MRETVMKLKGSSFLAASERKRERASDRIHVFARALFLWIFFDHDSLKCLTFFSLSGNACETDHTQTNTRDDDDDR